MSQTLAELVAIFLNEVKNLDPRLEGLQTGSLVDVIAGGTAACVNEAQVQNNLDYQKHFIQTATDSDLEYLATDLYGSTFSRPEPTLAGGFVNFSLPSVPTTTIVIPVGTIVKTNQTNTGTSIRFSTLTTTTLTPTAYQNIPCQIACTVIGTVGNVPANSITVIESTLINPNITVTNPNATIGGTDSMNDGDYRTYIYNLLQSFKKYTAQVIEDAALAADPNVQYASANEEPMLVDKVTTPTPTSFYVNRAKLFIGGNITPNVLARVTNATSLVKALGVFLEIETVIQYPLDWKVNVTLKADGPNYDQFIVGDFTVMYEKMKEYILSLPVCNGVTPVVFDVATATDYLLNYFTLDFTEVTTLIPAANVLIAQENEKFIPRTLSHG